jgi:adenine-specific DNA glycosylase
VFDFNQALMDLGATVCTARRPMCEICPLRSACVTRRVLAREAGRSRLGGVVARAVQRAR